MDGFQEKKWFIYVTDHHEGPFSLAEIQDKMKQGQVTPGNFFWTEGMADWTVMSQIPAFGSLMGESFPPLEKATDEIEMTQIKMSPVLEKATALGSIADVGNLSPKIEVVVNAPARNEEELDFLGKSAEKSKKEQKWEKAQAPKSRGFFKFLVILLILVGGAYAAFTQGFLDLKIIQPYLQRLADRFPVLANYISPIPQLDDVSPDEYEELKNVAGIPIENGLKATIAVSQTDLASPVFWVTTNAKGCENFDLYVHGIPDTLLNQLAFNTKIQANVCKAIAKTTPLKLDGSPIPRGQYVIYVVPSDHFPDSLKPLVASLPSVVDPGDLGIPVGTKMVTRKTYFLGGKKDAAYSERLKEFHDKLREKAQTELQEIKQFTGVLEGNLNETRSRFKTLSTTRKGKPVAAVQKKAWTDYEAQWDGLSAQMNQSFIKWTPDALKTEYFYGVLYQMVQQAFQAVQNVHRLHDAFFTSAVPVDRDAYDTQLAEASSSADAALAQLKNKISDAEKIPPTANGMPRKEGL